MLMGVSVRGSPGGQSGAPKCPRAYITAANLEEFLLAPPTATTPLLFGLALLVVAL